MNLESIFLYILIVMIFIKLRLLIYLPKIQRIENLILKNENL